MIWFLNKVGEAKLQLTPPPQFTRIFDRIVGEAPETEIAVEALVSVKPAKMEFDVSPEVKLTAAEPEGGLMIVVAEPPVLATTTRFPLKLIDSLYTPGET